MFEAFKFSDKIKETLEKIIKYKEKEEKYFQEQLNQSLIDTIAGFLKIENDMD